ncbi:hypothetical protein HOD75_03675 [archaeon]|jgi:predicted nucleic acid-binding protein|nr:hypothetical protein [archaeon]MBT4241970.1 hypothetical protein [archaeon]MBT4418517.1 hypothetical protein [archaeon]
MNNEKYLIFDSGPLINFSMNNLLHLLRRLKKEFPGKFIIPSKVKEETMDYPETTKKFQLGALQLETLFKDKIIETPQLSKAELKELNKKTNEIMNIANTTFKTKRKMLNLIHHGEAEVLALASMKKNSVIAIDERTTRMLCENPENLRKLLQKKLHTNVKANSKNYEFFKQFKVIRSTELIYIAYKKGLFDLKDPRALEAMLYGIKYKGCSVSEEEIREILRIK